MVWCNIGAESLWKAFHGLLSRIAVWTQSLKTWLNMFCLIVWKTWKKHREPQVCSCDVPTSWVCLIFLFIESQGCELYPIISHQFYTCSLSFQTQQVLQCPTPVSPQCRRKQFFQTIQETEPGFLGFWVLILLYFQYDSSFVSSAYSTC